MKNVSSSNSQGELVPKLRFPGFEGEWKLRELGDIIIPYGEKVYGDHDYDVLTSSRDGIRFQEDHFSEKQRHDTDGYNIIPKGYCTYRNRSDDGQFTFNINTISDHGIVSKFYPVFSFSGADSVYITNYLNKCVRAKKELSVLAVGTSQVVLSFETLKAAKFPMPTFEEQEKIGALIQTFDRRIEAQRKLVDSLKSYKRGALSAMFPKDGESAPRCRLSGFTGDWENRKLGTLAIFNPRCELPDTFEYVDLESVCGTEMIAHRTESKNSAPSRAQRLARTGDLFYQTVRPYQRNNFLFEITDSNYVFSTGYAQMRPLVNGRFLLCLVQSDSFVKTVLDRCTGTGYPAINSNDLAEIEVLSPQSSQEQEQIGNFFKKIDLIVAAQQQKYDLLLSAKRSLLQQMFI